MELAILFASLNDNILQMFSTPGGANSFLFVWIQIEKGSKNGNVWVSSFLVYPVLQNR